MSRSNPNTNTHPCELWIEWNGEKGFPRYYDKAKQENTQLKLPFTFVLLDKVFGITGWHDSSESSIYSNEIRDTRTDILTVKSFKGAGVLAQGLYADIRDSVIASGGKFTTNLYIGIHINDEFVIGCLKIKGAALNAWVDFEKANRKEIYSQGVQITGEDEGTKGSIVYYTPAFELGDIDDEANSSAMALDNSLQEYFKQSMSQVKPPVDDAGHNEDVEVDEKQASLDAQAPPEDEGAGFPEQEQAEQQGDDIEDKIPVEN